MADFYDYNDDCEMLLCTDPEEAMSEYLDEVDFDEWEQSVTICAFNKRSISEDDIKHGAKSLLDRALEELDDEYADRNSDNSRPTTSMTDAALTFFRAIVAEYRVGTCSLVPAENVVFDVPKFVRKHRADLLETPEAVAAIARLEGR